MFAPRLGVFGTRLAGWGLLLPFPILRMQLVVLKKSPDVVSALVVVVSDAMVPDAVRFAKPMMVLLCIATSAPGDIPVLLSQ